MIVSYCWLHKKTLLYGWDNNNAVEISEYNEWGLE